MTDYSDIEKYQNYVRVKRHIHMIETTTLTEDKLQCYSSFFRNIREQFPDLRVMNLENDSRYLRIAALQGETYMQILEQQFDSTVYLQFLKVIQFMLESLFEEDELNKMMNTLGL